MIDFYKMFRDIPHGKRRCYALDAMKAHMRKLKEFMAEAPFGYSELSEEELALFSAATTHDSYTMEAGNVNVYAESYERLEFLGDSVVEFIACEDIYLNSDLREGNMTDFKKDIVANEKISERTASYGMDIDGVMLLGNGFTEGNEKISEKMRADCFEALVGAVYLAKGMDEAKRVVKEVLFPDKRDLA